MQLLLANNFEILTYEIFVKWMYNEGPVHTHSHAHVRVCFAPKSPVSTKEPPIGS